MRTISILFCLFFHFLDTDAVCIDKPEEFDPSWVRIERTNPNKSIELLFALKQQNTDVLVNTLLNVSNPSHSKYGKYLSNTQIQEMIKPSHSTTNTIIKWLLSFNIRKNNIKNKTINGDFLTVLTTIQTAENILDCDYYNYYNLKIGKQKSVISRLDTNCHYDIPENIANHLDFISPTKRFPSIKHIINKPTLHTDISPMNDINVTPTFLNAIYQINNTKGQSPKSKMGIASFFSEYYTDSDIVKFWDQYNISNDIHSIKRISNSGIQPSGYGHEATMNVEFMTAIGQSIDTEVWHTALTNYTDNIITAEPFLLFLLDIVKSNNPPWLFIVGYSDYEFNLGFEYCSRCNIEFAKIGTMGITMLVASGDSGVGNDEQCCSRTPMVFCPMFPSTSPFVTSVGGAHNGEPDQWPTDETAYHPSGGGFSNFFVRPEWQIVDVENFIAEGEETGNLPYRALFNETGRGYPDVAAQSFMCYYTIKGENTHFNGTGCGVSIVGGIFALLNDIRFQNNLPSLGFLNPFIYQLYKNDNMSFNDIDCYCPNNACYPMSNHGFYALDYWDAVTGVGTPIFAHLRQHVLN